MNKLLSFLVMGLPFLVWAQDAVAPATAPFPWKENALVVLVVTTALGILSTFSNKLPGKFGELVQWLVDLISANVKHK